MVTSLKKKSIISSSITLSLTKIYTRVWVLEAYRYFSIITWCDLYRKELQNYYFLIILFIGIGNWGWIGFIDDRRRKRSVRVRQVPYFNYYWNGQYYQLQNTLNTLNSENSQCNANLQKTLATQQQFNDKEPLAKQLLQEIEIGATNLRSCVSAGGRTDLDLQTLTNYINNGGFVPVVQAQTRPQVYQAPPPAPPIWWMYRFDDRRREVVASISQMFGFKS